MSKLALGIDLGTTAVKAVVLDEGSEPVAFGCRPVRLITGPGGLVEQDVEEIWQAARGAVREAICGRRLGRNVRAISLSSQGGTLILLDKAGSPLGNAISWMDTRPASLSLSLWERVGVRDARTGAARASAPLTLPSRGGRGRGIDDALVYEKTGWGLRIGCLPLAQLLRLSSEGPDALRRAARVRFVDSYVVERLTGQAVTNPSDAAIATLYNVREGRWDGELLALAGVGQKMLPKVVPSGTAVGAIRGQPAKELGLSPSAVLHAGGHDQHCAAFGAGCRRAGDTIVSCGTAWVLLTLATEPRFPCAGLAPARAVTKGLWGLLGSCSSVGAATDWFRRFASPGGREIPFATLETAAAAVEPSAEMPVAILPAGGVSGKLLGLGAHHGFGHLARAVLECAAFGARWLLDSMRAAGTSPSLLKAVGGATRSRLWMQMLADATGFPLEIAGFQDAAAFGAARLAGQSAGIIPPEAPWPAPVARIGPRPQFRKVYESLYGRFQKGLTWRE